MIFSKRKVESRVNGDDESTEHFIEHENTGRLRLSTNGSKPAVKLLKRSRN